ncbi:MAG TPA: choice-of-anchor tandem repeat GloVer-containing protein [Candidatus Dormibacteraeota bacterium]|jgi:uncharacterized repeat protein (TIGR03803 family)|nr:choice-of-anchor tandem repeat GloVer-containing protein [Candidatus Dormibacteraeota bacterium]
MSQLNRFFSSVFSIPRLSSFAALSLALTVLSCLFASPQAQAQTLTVLHSFLGGEGEFPTFGLVRDSAGNLYGTSVYGGIFGNCDNEVGGGTVYKVDPSGNTTSLHDFNNGTDGCNPSSTLAIDSAGNLYGTSYPTVFKIDSAGNFTMLFFFSNPADGSTPAGTLFRDSQGNLYGTTAGGGNDGCQSFGCGTVFKLDASGNETVLYAFTGGADGAAPVAGVIRDAAGNFYGTTVNGGNYACQYGCGVVFKIDTTGKQTTLYTFTGGADGQWPATPLVRDSAGNLYGVTESGGDLNCGKPHVGCGTVYKVTPAGNKSILYAFKAGSDGSHPTGGLARDSAGNLYGTTAYGGDAHNDGIVFKLGNFGHERVLHRFNNIEGSQPWGGVILDAEGNLYGTTQYGGSLGQGIVFKLAP